MTAPVQSVRRSIAILMALNRRNGSTASQISAEVSLSRGTVFRILATLMREDLVWKDSIDNTYWLRPRVQALSEGYVDEAWIIGIARPALQQLASKIVWPVSVQRLEQGAMRVRACTDSQSPLALWRSTVGATVQFFDSAGGLVYLAYATAGRRREILALARALQAEGADPESPDLSDKNLERIRTDGYNVARKIVDTTVAMPIFVGSEIFACLTARYMNRGISHQKFMTQFGPLLRATAAAIGRSLSEATADQAVEGAVSQQRYRPPT